MSCAVLFSSSPAFSAGLAVQSDDGAERCAGATGVVLNHVGLSVPSIPDAAAFYTQKLGFKEAFRNSDAQGNPTAIYLQISKTTFLELQQANAQRPAGDQSLRPGSAEHQGDRRRRSRSAARRPPIRALRARSRTPSWPTSPISNGLRIELAEMGPESLQRKAMDSWK